MTRDRDDGRPAGRRAAVGRPGEPAVSVLVLGPAAAAESLARQLPAGWRVRRAAAIPSEPADLLVVYAATGARVAAVRAAYPDTGILGVVATGDPVDVVVDILEAGADTCCRDRGARIVAGYLVACHRRRGFAVSAT